jgi:hypothetical protein
MRLFWAVLGIGGCGFLATLSAHETWLLPTE